MINNLNCLDARQESFVKEKGITLIALVITIIVLLILAGISISSLTGSGLFEKAQQAKEKTENAQEKENIILSEYQKKLNSYTSGSGSVWDVSDATESWDVSGTDDGSIQAYLISNGDDTYTLKIKGTGKMASYSTTNSPWYTNRSNITTVLIQEGITSIGKYAFSNCSSLTSIILPNSITTIGDWAFSWCSSLTSITLPNSITTIGTMVFCNDFGLVTINYNGSSEQWSNITKSTNWTTSSGHGPLNVTQVTCTDGTVEI